MAGRGHPVIDYAQAVLSKYPDAHAFEYPTSHDNRWQIRKSKSKPISGWWADRDAAWRDAYERIYKKGE